MIQKEKKEVVTQESDGTYFKFDTVEHFYLNIAEHDVYELDKANREKKSQEKEMLLEVIGGHTPTILPDESYGRMLEKMHFSKTIMDPSKHKAIREVFRVTRCANGFAAACEPIYRDIFIFKNKGKITGFAKICFDCRLFHIVGTDKDQSDFGQCGGYEKLQRLIE
ncbi:hypothetical protein E6C50_02695 [Flavobacterium supellecticarium]|uniref:Uncharacterized protein n=1 Tax=Flavobacterium supellecticarium TaxID=2565924 RepID=A0A4S4A3W5_9FLAO|nr:hypothetical protein [Flavobacterium supellecticarium]THF53131.1 hypothetical protein E6C50_02695 [Flavobacterium supellecticarium]